MNYVILTTEYNPEIDLLIGDILRARTKDALSRAINTRLVVNESVQGLLAKLSQIEDVPPGRYKIGPVEVSDGDRTHPAGIWDLMVYE
jgi:hypothetical protein